MNKTEKIIAVILEELNGYTKSDAERLAPEEAGSPIYEKIKAILNPKSKG